MAPARGAPAGARGVTVPRTACILLRTGRGGRARERSPLRRPGDLRIDAPTNPAFDAILPQFYDELRRLAAQLMQHEAPSASLQPTALAHEAYMRLARRRSELLVERAYLMTAAAGVIRDLLVDHARARKRLKRGGGWTPVPLEGLELPGVDPFDLVDLDEALESLHALHPRQARVVELRFFGQLTIEETAQALGVSARTVNGDWRMARAWLRTQLDDPARDEPAA